MLPLIVRYFYLYILLLIGVHHASTEYNEETQLNSHPKRYREHESDLNEDDEINSQITSRVDNINMSRVLNVDELDKRVLKLLAKMERECGNKFPQQAKEREKIGYISNGRDSPYGEFPSYVSVVQRHPEGNFKLVCGGTLLTERHIITSAYCYNRAYPPATVNVFSDNVFNNVKAGQASSVSQICGSSYINEQNYEGQRWIIAELENKFDFGIYTQSACLPKRPLQDDEAALQLGWGAGDVNVSEPLILQAWSVKRTKCYEKYDYKNICFEGKDRAHRGMTCKGDEGSGAFAYQDGKQTLFGVNHSAYPNCRKGVNAQAIGSDVMFYKRKILETIIGCTKNATEYRLNPPHQFYPSSSMRSWE